MSGELDPISFNAVVEVDGPLTSRRASKLLDALAPYHPAVGRAESGRTEITITFDADFLEVAASRALNILRLAGPLLTLFVMTTEEFDRRTDAIRPSKAQLLGTTAAAEYLGVSRQRVQQLAADNALPYMTVGNALAFLEEDLDKYAAAHPKN